MASLENRANGTVRVRFTADGQRKSMTFATHKEAVQFLADKERVKSGPTRRAIETEVAKLVDEKVNARIALRDNGAGKLPLGQAIDRFLASRTSGFGDSPPCTPETVRGYKDWSDRMRMFFGDQFVEDITKDDARRYRAFLATLDRSERIKSACYTIATMIWNYLIGEDVVDANVFELATKGQRRTGKRQQAAKDLEKDAFTYDELFRLWEGCQRLRQSKSKRTAWNYVSQRTAAILLVQMTTGLRRSEVLGLTIDSFQRQRRILTITQTVAQGGRVGTVKTANSARTVSLHPDVAAVLTDWIDNQRQTFLESGVKSRFIFCLPDGAPIKGNTWSQVFERFRDKQKVRRLGMHCLRHAMTSILIDCHVDDLRVIRTMGHDTMAFSRTHYGHVMSYDGDDNARAFIQERVVAATGLTMDKLKVLMAS